MNIIGINAYHGDSSACIIVDGVLVAAVEEERFKRIKHWAGFPSESISYCLSEANISLENIDYVAINTDPKANFFEKVVYSIFRRPNLSLIYDRLAKRKKKKSIQDEFKIAFPNNEFNGEVRYVEHHLSHLASAHLVSPFDDSVTVSVDGFGDFSSGSWGAGSGNAIQIDKNIHFPHSLGIFYQAFTQYLGFPHFGDEYKVMGLAPYGKPKYLDRLRKVIKPKQDGSYKLSLKYFMHHKGIVDQGNIDGVPTISDLFNLENVEALLGFPPRMANAEMQQFHFDLAHSVQAMYEEIFFYMLNKLHDNYKIDNLTLAGGCANNSVANGKVYRRTPFKKMYIAASAGDSGGSIGAAFVELSNTTTDKNLKLFSMKHAYYGPSYSNTYISTLLKKYKDSLVNFSIKKIDNPQVLCQTVAKMIANDNVIGWFQGRMEWGPRALGNRSILADPRKGNMKDIINSKIKKRESFRPFAPSILRESVSEWFEEDDDVPFMMQVFLIKEDKRKLIPAVTHIDGTGRLQTVSQDSNPLYHMLISAFNDITNTPILLNTSFNENEPVVCKPEEALDCFLRTSMDAVVLGNYIVSR
jgi:carbamoyltransferase